MSKIDIEAELRALGEAIDEWCDSPQGRAQNARLWARLFGAGTAQGDTTMSALTSADYPVCAEMFRRTYHVEVGTAEAADAIYMPAEQPNREYWRSQVEWIATTGWAYGLVYSDHSVRRYRDLPDDLRDFGTRSRLPGRAPELPADGAWQDADGVWHHPPITAEDNRASLDDRCERTADLEEHV